VPGLRQLSIRIFEGFTCGGFIVAGRGEGLLQLRFPIARHSERFRGLYYAGLGDLAGGMMILAFAMIAAFQHFGITLDFGGE
jgi:hypothetical protein